MNRKEQWLLVTNVDDVLPSANKSSCLDLARVLKRNEHKIIMAYSSSGICKNAKERLAKIAGFPKPQFIIGANGTEIQNAISENELLPYRDLIKHMWKRKEITDRMSKLGFKEDTELQAPFKISYTVSSLEVYQMIYSRLMRSRFYVQVTYSNGSNVDIIPKFAGKGAAVSYLGEWLGIQSNQVIIADSLENIRKIVRPPLKGIVVNNNLPAQENFQNDFLYFPKAPFFSGILEGLSFWKVIKEDVVKPQEYIW